ncbi:probable G protein-coupled receptor 85 [Centruroides vittatus]|uniref:probable G protein-coupled receptor 85 n=1 Tax=Centruroides vittatus TaxID=120091 RepID=UPI00350F0E2E
MVGFVSLDLIRVCVCFPVIFVTVLVQRFQWKYTSDLCQLMAFTNLFCVFGNSLIMLAIAVDRYVETKFHLFHRRKLGHVLGPAFLLLVWGLAFLFCYPAVYGIPALPEIPLEDHCTFPHYYYTDDTDILGLLFSLLIVIFLTNFIYCKLFIYLRHRRRMRPIKYEPATSENWSFGDGAVAFRLRQRWLAASLSTSSGNRDIRHFRLAWRNHLPRRNSNLTKTCYLIHLIFTIMWLPYVTVAFLYTLQREGKIKRIPDWLEVLATSLTYLQVAITPFAFFSLSRLSRKSLRFTGRQFSG